MPRLSHPSTVVVLLTAAIAGSPLAARAQYGATDGEWRHYGGDNGGTKYSPLDQIDAANFDELRIAWRWASADGALDLEALREQRQRVSIRGFQATPLMIDGVLYLSTAMYASGGHRRRHR